jgi:hypothetical protein
MAIKPGLYISGKQPQRRSRTMKEKPKEIKPDSGGMRNRDIIILVLVVFILGMGGYWLMSQDEGRIAELGRKVCLAHNMTFNYARGEYTYCYTLDKSSGIKTPASFWMDLGICQQIYENNLTKPNLSSDLGFIYTTDEQIDLDKGCKKGAGLFNISGNITICYHCINKSQSMNPFIHAGSWLCPV